MFSRLVRFSNYYLLIILLIYIYCYYYLYFYKCVSGLNVMGISNSEITDIFRLVAGVLHIGNIKFVENGNYSQIANEQCTY